LLAGILWSKLYWIDQTIFPDSYHGVASLDWIHGGLDGAYRNEFDLLYYSVTIMTSVGLGDVLPEHHSAKSLTMLEAMFGQLYVAIAIAKMVSFWRPVHKEP
jgi:Ion channel